MPLLVLKVCFGVLSHTPIGGAYEQGTIRLRCSSLTNPVTSVTLTYIYIHSFFFITLPGMYASLSLPLTYLTTFTHVLPPIRHSPDDDACIGIKMLGNKVSLRLESKMNSTSIIILLNSIIYSNNTTPPVTRTVNFRCSVVRTCVQSFSE